MKRRINTYKKACTRKRVELAIKESRRLFASGECSVGAAIKAASLAKGLSPDSMYIMHANLLNSAVALLGAKKGEEVYKKHMSKYRVKG